MAKAGQIKGDLSIPEDFLHTVPTGVGKKVEVYGKRAGFRYILIYGSPNYYIKTI